MTLPAKAQNLPSDIKPPSGQWLYLYSNSYNGSYPPSQTDIDRYLLVGGSARKVWTRTTNNWLNSYGAKMNFHYSTVYCDRQKYRFDYAVSFNANGVVISQNRQKPIIYTVVPGTNAEAFYEAVCR